MRILLHNFRSKVHDKKNVMIEEARNFSFVSIVLQSLNYGEFVSSNIVQKTIIIYKSL